MATQKIIGMFLCLPTWSVILPAIFPEHRTPTGLVGLAIQLIGVVLMVGQIIKEIRESKGE